MLGGQLDDRAAHPGQVLLITKVPVASDEKMETSFISCPEQIVIGEVAPSDLRGVNRLMGPQKWNQRRGTLWSSKSRMMGLLPRICDDSACPFYSETWEHVVDVVRCGVIHIFGDARCEDSSARDGPVAAAAFRKTFNVSTFCPIDHGITSGPNIARNQGRGGG